jgi:cell division protein FtsB
MGAAMKADFSLSGWLRQHSTGILVLACSVLLLQDVFGAHGLMAMQRSQREAVQVRAEIQRLDTENAKLEYQIHALKTDPSLIECIARDQIGLTRQGETVFRLPQNGKQQDDSEACLDAALPNPAKPSAPR